MQTTKEDYIGYVHGGPITVSTKGDQIEILSDDQTAAGPPFEHFLQGSLKNRLMSGKFGPPRNASEAIAKSCIRFPGGFCSQPTGTWSVKPLDKKQFKKMTPKPVDLSGHWSGSGGTRKWSMDVTAKAQKFKDGFDVEFDLPS